MASETPTKGRCNDPAWLNEKEREDPDASKSGYCEQYPVTDDDGDPKTGRCRMHFGHGYGDNGAPEGNGNALTHGALASPLNLYDHLESGAVEWVDSLVDGYLHHAPFGREDPRRERLTRYCVMIYQEWSATEEILTDGASESQPVGVTDDGEPVIRDEEHHLGTRERALNTKIRQGLKELGCLPGSGSDAEAGETVAQIFAAAVEQASAADGSQEDSSDDTPETIPAEGGEVSAE